MPDATLLDLAREIATLLGVRGPFSITIATAGTTIALTSAELAAEVPPEPPATPPAAPSNVPLTDADRTILDSIGAEHVNTKEAARLSGYRLNSYFRGLIREMLRKGLLVRDGYGKVHNPGMPLV